MLFFFVSHSSLHKLKSYHYYSFPISNITCKEIKKNKKNNNNKINKLNIKKKRMTKNEKVSVKGSLI